MNFAVTYVTTAAEHPVSAEELKLHAHVDGNDEDESIDIYIAAATRAGQKRSDRQFCTATMRLTLDEFPIATRHNPKAAIYVPRPPLQSVTSIGYVDSSGTTATLASTDYIVDAASEPGRIMPRYGDTWPTPREQIAAVTVTYVAGYGAAGAVPGTIRQWILARSALAYRLRESAAEMDMKEVGHLDALLDIESYGAV